MNPRLKALIQDLEARPPVDVELLRQAAADTGVALPEDYLEFMGATNGAVGDVGSTWIELWPIDEILHAAAYGDSPYECVFLFAGDGANTIYGFDARASNEIVEGDWIGVSREQLIRHGRSFTDFLSRLAARG
jgi:hypothetical protein